MTWQCKGSGINWLEIDHFCLNTQLLTWNCSFDIFTGWYIFHTNDTYFLFLKYPPNQYWQKLGWVYIVKNAEKHDDVISWKHFLHYYPFVKGIHWWQVDYLHKGPLMQGFDFFCFYPESAAQQSWVACDLRCHTIHEALLSWSSPIPMIPWIFNNCMTWQQALVAISTAGNY